MFLPDEIKKIKPQLYNGTVHDKHKGIPKISNKVRKWLVKNGWKGND